MLFGRDRQCRRRRRPRRTTTRMEVGADSSDDRMAKAGKDLSWWSTASVSREGGDESEGKMELEAAAVDEVRCKSR